MDNIYQDLSAKLFTDLKLIIKDPKFQIEVDVHKVVLHYSSPYFRKMMEENRDTTSVVLQVPDAGIMQNVVMSFYGVNKYRNNPNHLYVLQWIQCQHLLELELDPNQLYGIAVPEDNFDMFISVAKLFDPCDQKLVRTLVKNLPRNYPLENLPAEFMHQIEKNGQLLATVHEDIYIKIWSAYTGECLNVLNCPIEKRDNWPLRISIDNPTFSHNGQYLIYSLAEHTYRPHPRKPQTRTKRYCNSFIKIWDIINEVHLRTLHVGEGYITSLKFCEDDSHIIAGDSNNIVRYWNMANLKLEGEFGERIKGRCIISALLLLESKFIVSSGRCTRYSPGIIVKLWNTVTGRCVKTINNIKLIGQDLIFSNNLAYFVSTGKENVNLFDTQTCKHLHSWDKEDITSIIFSSNDSNLVTAHSDGFVNFWDLKEWDRVKCFNSGLHSIRYLEFMDGTNLLVGGSDPQENTIVAIFNTESEQCTMTTTLADDNVINLKLLHNKKLLVRSKLPYGYWYCNFGKLSINDMESGKILHEFKNGGHSIKAICVSKNCIFPGKNIN